MLQNNLNLLYRVTLHCIFVVFNILQDIEFSIQTIHCLSMCSVRGH